MTINCAGAGEPTVVSPTKKLNFTPGTRTMLQKLAEARHAAMEAQAAMYRSVDPIVAATQAKASKAQMYWEQMVFESGRMGLLSSNRARNTETWLANFLGVKLNTNDIREPLLNMKRVAEGTVREAAVYRMLSKTNELSTEFKRIAKARGVKVQADDVRRILEEGMTPQRLSVYGNSELQQSVLMGQFEKFRQSFINRGFTEGDIQDLLDRAMDVSSQYDEVSAVTQATGLHVGELYNRGFFNRQLTRDGLHALALTKGVPLDKADDWAQAALKSRSTWQYLPEDHSMAAHLLGIGEDELHGLIADPVEFALHLSRNVKAEDIDLLVDSGVFSKIPMLTSQVAEYMTKMYNIPLTPAEMFIADPLEASAHQARKLRAMVEQSALKKYVKEEGFKSGWSINSALKADNPELYHNYVPLQSVRAFASDTGDTFLHPAVASHLNGILNLASDPAAMAEAGAAMKLWHGFTASWSRQALGNPIAAKVYLTGQFVGNMMAVFGRGVSISHYLTSVADLIQLSTKGLDAFDNVKPYRFIDGQAVTHRELVARSTRMFSRDVLPGIKGDNVVLDWKNLNPLYTYRQIIQLHEMSKTTPQYAKELGRLAMNKLDSTLTPALRVAQILDLASQLAVIKGKAPLAAGGVGKALNTVDQALLGWSFDKLHTWDDLVLEVKRTTPMFDDMGGVQATISRIAPFSAWAMGNLPLQVKSMMREPSRWMNYLRLQQLWNDNQYNEAEKQKEFGAPVRGEFQQWELDMYGLLLGTDPLTRKHTVLFHSQVDPRMAAFAGIAGMFRPQNMADLRGETRESPGTKLLQSLIGSSYLAGIYEAASGVDPKTGIKRDDNPYRTNSFAGVPLPPWVGSILSISPLLDSIDRLPLLSGTKPVVDARTGAVIREGVNGWLGTQGKLSQQNTTALEATAQFLGGRVRVIDGVRNMQYTEMETQSTILRLQTEAFKQQKDLYAQVRAGSVQQDSDVYRKRLAVIHRIYDTSLQLNMDLQRIQAWAVVHKVPSKKALEELRNRGIATDKLPLPGGDYVQQLIQQGMEFKYKKP